MKDHKNCPYCGEVEMLKAVVAQARPGVKKGFIECDNCGARGQTQYGSCDPDEMLDLVWSGWNERVDAAPSPVQRVEELEAALKPFAAVGEKIATGVPDQLADLFLVKIEGEDRIKHFPTLTISDFSRARALLDSKEGK